MSAVKARCGWRLLPDEVLLYCNIVALLRYIVILYCSIFTLLRYIVLL